MDAFTGFGVEIEYCIVGIDDLDCRPIADRILASAAGPGADTVERGLLGWSNEFVLHMLEVKNLLPAARLEHLAESFRNEVAAINDALLGHGARLIPTAMHPWMNPLTETHPWPIDPHNIYRTYRRIFDTRTHGWANLQSMHLNLPFADDAQFARLHESIRLVLPIIPALAASSPIADERATGCRDFRMQAYRCNSDAYPLVTGRVIPDTVTSREAYEGTVLEPMYAAMTRADPRGALRHEWLNARGAIARFDRNAIEIRVIDTQECPEADLAVAAAVAATVHFLYREAVGPKNLLHSIATENLVRILETCIRDAEDAVIDDATYLGLFRFPGLRCRARDLWRHIVGLLADSEIIDASRWALQWEVMLEHGSLARRIERAIGSNRSRERLVSVYRDLCDCLGSGTMFIPGTDTHACSDTRR
ncbi:carboxylate-amine ligase [Microvirga sp. 2TAF3]|uniref:carboxylate-amine ligase n=1 Tax=Microvirga sp. 2TAF3 TaxID=3233014 RepID=UPI003F9C505C